jgi:uncharacterized membrane protein
MNSSRKRAMTVTLVALGILIIALGGVLAATFPWGQGWTASVPQADGTQNAQPQGPQAQGPQAQGPQAGVPPSGYYGPSYAWHGWHRPWYGYGYGPWGFHGPRFFGGGFLFLVLIILAVSFFVRRRRYWRYGRRDDGLDAEEILRRSFAEGRITEEEYTQRLGALRK